MGMEMTASCEGGQKCSRPTTPIIPASPSQPEREKTPPKPIYLEGALPPQCELLVTDSETQAEKTEEDAEAPVVLSGKMTLSLISLDQIAAESEDEESKVKRGNGTNYIGIEPKTIQDKQEDKEMGASIKSSEEEKTNNVSLNGIANLEDWRDLNEIEEKFVLQKSTNMKTEEVQKGEKQEMRKEEKEEQEEEEREEIEVEEEEEEIELGEEEEEVEEVDVGEDEEEEIEEEEEEVEEIEEEEIEEEEVEEEEEEEEIEEDEVEETEVDQEEMEEQDEENIKKQPKIEKQTV